MSEQTKTKNWTSDMVPFVVIYRYLNLLGIRRYRGALCVALLLRSATITTQRKARLS